jgi:crotonobetainyl-CoA:carnitine CoA-transferase CaiB-like acyl-CoA transferase
MSPSALADVKVLEWSHRITGQYTAKLMADLGAEVIKLEPPDGDPARRYGPFPQDIPHPERSGLFLNLNTNKRGITLDVTTSTGKELFYRLVQQVDVLVEDHRPQDVEALGFDYATLARHNPRLVMTSVTPFGQTGPYRNYKGCHLTAFHASGQGYLLPPGTPFLDRPPVVAGAHAGDYQCAFGAATATLAALLWRETSGQGQHVDVSEQEWGVGLAALFLIRYPLDGFIESRQSQLYTFLGKMPCKDGHVVILVMEGHHWTQLVEMLGRPAWALDEKYNHPDNRRKDGLLLTERVKEWLRDKTRKEVLQLGMQYGVPVGYVATSEDIFASPQLQARGFFQPLEHSETGPLPYPTAAYHLSATPLVFKRPAPLLGEHNTEVYEQLGYSREDLLAWRRCGII